jgi:hypothetical protein
VTNKCLGWKFCINDTLEAVKWEDGLIGRLAPIKMQQTNFAKNTHVALQVCVTTTEMSIPLYHDRLITTNPARIDNSCKERTVWYKVESERIPTR